MMPYSPVRGSMPFETFGGWPWTPFRSMSLPSGEKRKRVSPASLRLKPDTSPLGLQPARHCVGSRSWAHSAMHSSVSRRKTTRNPPGGITVPGGNSKRNGSSNRSESPYPARFMGVARVFWISTQSAFDGFPAASMTGKLWFCAITSFSRTPAASSDRDVRLQPAWRMRYSAGAATQAPRRTCFISSALRPASILPLAPRSPKLTFPTLWPGELARHPGLPGAEPRVQVNQVRPVPGPDLPPPLLADEARRVRARQADGLLHGEPQVLHV